MVAFKNGKNCSIFKILSNGRIIDLIRREKNTIRAARLKIGLFCIVPRTTLSTDICRRVYAALCGALSCIDAPLLRRYTEMS